MSARECLAQAQALIADAVNELPAATVRVRLGEPLQAAVDAATGPTEILVVPGIYEGLMLRAKPAGTSITIRPDTTALPASGERITPDYREACVQLRATLNGSAVKAEPAAHDYTLIGCAGLPSADGTMVQLGSDTAVDPFDQPTDLVLDRCLWCADPATGGRRAIQAHTRRLTIRGCWIDDWWHKTDGHGQGITGSNGPGPVLIDNCFIRASMENVLAGGADSRTPALMPSALTLRRSTLTKRPEWQQRTDITCKNILELKAMRGALIEGNVLEYCWVGGQNGLSILMTPRNQNGKAPWSEVTGIVFRFNVVRHVAGGFNMLATDDINRSGPLRNVAITDNLLYDVNATYGAQGRCFLLNSGPANVEIARNTIVGPNVRALLAFCGKTPCDGLAVHHNVATEGLYGLLGDNVGSGLAAWQAYTLASCRFDENLLEHGPNKITYPGTGNIVGPAVVDAGYRVTPTYQAQAGDRGVNIARLVSMTGATLF